MREYFQVPVTALVKSQGLGLDALALVEPLAVAAHGIRRASIMAGETVLIVGAGPIGIGLILFAKKAGARIIVMEKHAKRSAFCKKELGVHAVLDPSILNTQELIYDMTEGAMPDVVIDATGNLQALENSFRYISHGGRYVLVGLQKGEIRFSHPEFHKREATLMSSRNATREDFENVIGSIADGTTNPMSMMTHRIPFQETPSAFPELLQPDSECIKAMIVF
jgi:2-desacetyl-2-hydroxyethyl bacteriochlorophyllide A dehydrogenase